MDAALGPPEKMVDCEEDLTPMMSQYFELCRRYDDSLVLFQVGDFYETFCEAADVTARLCEITLTKREDSTGRYPMAGIPIDNAENYIETLLDAGYRVAVADQIEDPKEATGVVERAVTRIVTPGTLTEDELLRGDDNNFVACLAREEAADAGGYGLALLDVSTGDFYATSAIDGDAVADELDRFAPAEAVVGPAVAPGAADDLFAADCMVSPYDESAFEYEAARGKVACYFGSPDDLLATDTEVRACGALLAYAEYARGGQEGRLDYLNHVTRYDPREYVLLDAVALRSLELFERRTVHGVDGATLVGTLDETACALGSRTLTDWLRRPLLDRRRIEARHEAVSDLTSHVQARERVHDLLQGVYDIERLVSRVARGRANARDLRSLEDSLNVVPKVRQALVGVEADRLCELSDGLDDLPEVRDLIDRAVREDPPAELTEGNLIREGYSEKLDELREAERSGKEWIDNLEARERERTGIDSLKVGYNSVHGYYIEVTDANLERVPDDYTRRQTLKNAERFVTPDLKEREDEIIKAESAADDLEYELFTNVRATVADEAERVQTLADVLAELDVLIAFAEVAAKHGYTRPEFGGDGIRIQAGRHPVVERTEPSFVPNDTDLAAGEVTVITGPNMSGKSTFMRQVALVQILAQAGSFVPAAAAELRLIDRVFTRVGASDDIAGGRSTFMVEMTELADILRAATEDSLVLLDEVGRGTSTADGLAIARAVTEYVHDEIGATTLFATHHHDLTAVAADHPRVVNLHFDAAREDGNVTFDHHVRPGPAAASYGVDVARMAGVPNTVVERSRELINDERHADPEGVDAGTANASIVEGTDHANAVVRDKSRRFGGQDNTGPEGADGVRANGHGGEGVNVLEDVVSRLEAMDMATTTPLEALNTLAELKREIGE